MSSQTLKISNQAETIKMVPVYHRSRTEWVREGDPVAFTPGCGLEEANAHLFPNAKIENSDEVLPLKRYQEPNTWATASAWALAHVKETGMPVELLLDDDKQETSANKNDK